MTASAVYELDEHGSRLLYAAGSPEADEFHRVFGDPSNPIILEPLIRAETPVDAPEAPDDEVPEPKNDVVEEPATETDPEQETAAGTEPGEGALP